jgi:hypothetical protein
MTGNDHVRFGPEAAGKGPALRAPSLAAYQRSVAQHGGTRREDRSPPPRLPERTRIRRRRQPAGHSASRKQYEQQPAGLAIPDRSGDECARGRPPCGAHSGNATQPSRAAAGRRITARDQPVPGTKPSRRAAVHRQEIEAGPFKLYLASGVERRSPDAAALHARTAGTRLRRQHAGPPAARHQRKARRVPCAHRLNPPRIRSVGHDPPVGSSPSRVQSPGQGSTGSSKSRNTRGGGSQTESAVPSGC